MPPVGGRLTVKLRHKSGNAQRRSRLLRDVGRVVPMCAVLQADRADIGGLRERLFVWKGERSAAEELLGKC